MKTEICFIIQCYANGGGTERVLSQISSGLVKMGYGVSVISIEKGKTPVFETDSRVNLFELKRPNIRKKGKMLGRVAVISEISVTRRELLRLAKEIKPQIVIAVDTVLYHYADYLRKKLKIKSVAWEHYCLDSRKGIIINYSRRLAIKNASLTVVISKGDLRSYKERFKKADNLKLIYNPLPTKEIIRGSPDAKAVIAMGRLTYQKGFDMLLSAWKLVEKEAPDWRLLIYGDGEDKDTLLSQAQKYGLKGVRFMGYTESPHKEMEKGSIFVLPSRYEGFGLVLLEAQAKGLACVSFNCKEGPREIIDDGINGFLVEEGNVSELSKKLLRLIKNDNLRKSFMRSASKDLYRFYPERILMEWDNAIREIMKS